MAWVPSLGSLLRNVNKSIKVIQVGTITGKKSKAPTATTTSHSPTTTHSTSASSSSASPRELPPRIPSLSLLPPLLRRPPATLATEKLDKSGPDDHVVAVENFLLPPLPIQKSNKRKSTLVPRLEFQEQQQQLPEGQVIVCSICDVRISKSGLKRHLENHKHVVKADTIATGSGGGGGTKYKCSICNEGFDVRLTAETHIATHYDQGEIDDKDFTPHLTFTCFFCWKLFGNKCIYMNHVQFHLQNHDILFEKPPRLFKNFSELQIHNPVMDCGRCKKKLFILNGTTTSSTNVLQQQQNERLALGQQINLQFTCKSHQAHHASMPIPCNICGKPLRTNEAHTVHHLSHAGLDEFLSIIEQFHTNYNCCICGANFGFVASLINHARVVHGGSSSPSGSITTTTNDNNNENKEANFKCNKCGKVYFNGPCLRGHISQHAKQNIQALPHVPEDVPKKIAFEDCTVCRLEIIGAPVEKSSTEVYYGQQVLYRCKTHIAWITARWICSICGYAATYQNALPGHVMKHLPKEEQVIELAKRKEFLCTSCGLSFVSKHSLESHTKAVHEDQQVYKCTFNPAACQKSVKTKQSFKEHVKLHEAGAEQPFACLKCEESFQLESQLAQHVKFFCTTLSSFKPIECEICGKKFGSRKNLRHHKSRVHGFSSYEPRGCELCFGSRNKVYKDTTAYRMHLIRAHGKSGVEARGIAFPHLPPIGESERAKKRRRKAERLEQQKLATT